MKRLKLSSDEVTEEISKITGWSIRNQKLYRQFHFKDFKEAFRFMTRVAVEAERMDHHPDWKNVYNRIEVELNTHDLGGISNLDFDLAIRMNEIFESKIS